MYAVAFSFFLLESLRPSFPSSLSPSFSVCVCEREHVLSALKIIRILCHKLWYTCNVMQWKNLKRTSIFKSETCLCLRGKKSVSATAVQVTCMDSEVRSDMKVRPHIKPENIHDKIISVLFWQPRLRRGIWKLIMCNINIFGSAPFLVMRRRCEAISTKCSQHEGFDWLRHW